MRIAYGVALAALAWPVYSQNQTAEVPVSMVVTAEGTHGHQPPEVHKTEVTGYQGKEKVAVSDWLPLRDGHAGLDFMILIDDAANTSLGSQLEDIRTFIANQPPTTAIGIAYMQNGTVQVAANPTTDHAAAAAALRLPMGSIAAINSPFFSLQELIKRWPPEKARREVLMISDGIDRFGGSDPYNPYVNEAIDTAVKAGILVYTIYTPGIGHYGHSFWSMNWGQNYLSEVSDATGAESYFVGFGNPVSFVPWLNEITERLQNQYLVTILAKPGKKPGFQNVRFTTEIPKTEIVSARRVWVPETK